MAELADALDSGSSEHYAHAGSSPVFRTIVGASIVSLAPTFLRQETGSILCIEEKEAFVLE